MPDIDIVIKALKICAGEEDFQYCVRNQCPYSGSNPGFCITNLERDALALLIDLDGQIVRYTKHGDELLKDLKKINTAIKALQENGWKEEQTQLIHCNECVHYEGVHNVQGHAPCNYWNSGGVLWNGYCHKAEKWNKTEGG